MLIYIACPYTKGDVARNVKNASMLFDYIADTGHTPYNPLLTHFQHMLYQRPYEWWLEYDLIWLKKCDAVVRLAGESNGADKEVSLAMEIGLQVFELEGFDSLSMSKLDQFLLITNQPKEKK